MIAAMRLSQHNHVRLLRYAGFCTYLVVGIPLLQQSLAAEDVVGTTTLIERWEWFGCYALFGLGYWLITRDLGARGYSPAKLVWLVLVNLAAFGIAFFSHSGLFGILLMVLAGVLPWLLPFRPAVAWLALEYFVMVPVIVFSVAGYDWIDALLQGVLYLGFSGFTFVTSLVAKQQAEARDEQRRLNSELRATRALLAESSRIAERLRIARDLHDLVGHHLTALSLNLEVASHLVQAPAQEHVRQAQSIAKLLLSDVREVVSQLRQDDAIDLTQALRSLVEGVPQLAIHLDLPPRFGVEDPQRAQVLLRCTQEIVTNTVRHAAARNLWLRFEQTPDQAIAIHARDDGRGSDTLSPGNGLTGMRERLAEFGGRLNIETARDRGFALDAWLPLETAS
jgi:signal transduction histidine kinase